MSFFSVALHAAIEDIRMTQSELARQTGIDSGLINRYVTGKVRPSAQILEKICLVFPEPERAAIATGHLRDELPPSAKKLVRVLPTEEGREAERLALLQGGHDEPSAVGEYGSERTRLPRELREAFKELEAMCVDNPDLASHIKNLPRMLR